MAEPDLCACEYVVIRLAPDPIRQEHVNIGVALYESGSGHFAGVRLNPDLRRVRRLSPAFEEADLAGLEADLLARLERAPGSPMATAAPWTAREYFLQLAQETFSHTLQLSVPTAVLTADPAAELDRLYREFALPPAAPDRGLAEAGRRRRILQHLSQVFQAERVYAHLQRNVRAGDLLGQPDHFRFDFHYLGSGRPHFIQAVPLGEDEDLVKTLCFTLERMRHRWPQLDVAGFQDAESHGRRPPGAVQPRLPLLEPDHEALVAYQSELLMQAGVRCLTLEEAPAEAARIRAALHRA